MRVPIVIAWLFNFSGGMPPPITLKGGIVIYPFNFKCGPVESVNSRIKLIKRNANGYRNFERFRKRVLYSLNRNSFISFK